MVDPEGQARIFQRLVRHSGRLSADFLHDRSTGAPVIQLAMFFRKLGALHAASRKQVVDMIIPSVSQLRRPMHGSVDQGGEAFRKPPTKSTDKTEFLSIGQVTR
jgi:hypothetical protein